MAGIDFPVRIRTEFRGSELLRDMMALLHRVRDAAGPSVASEVACQLIIRMDAAVKAEDVVVTASAGGPFLPISLEGPIHDPEADTSKYSPSGSGDGG